ncbi:MAG: ribonuclease Z [Desulfohalobiaceae bacterium]|nr:ribonuclease Z [Desulfohalobiaceae bacterium]
MQAEFLGVGEACDETLPNTSVLVRCEGDPPRRILLDCGFTAPPPLFASLPDPEALDAVWISHFHGDHIFGLPLVLLRMWESGRRRKLIFAGQEGITDRIRQIAELAYPGLEAKLGFKLEVKELGSGQSAHFLDLTWTAAQTLHSRRNLALRLENDGASLYYSGDGPASAESEDMARDCGLMIHEAYTAGQDRIPGHATVPECLDLARRTGASSLALVHLQREERRRYGEELKEWLDGFEDISAFLPEPGEMHTVEQGSR